MSALGDVLEALRLVEERLDEARGQLAGSRELLGQAVTALTRLDPENPESVVPPGYGRADDQIERSQAAIEQIMDTLRDFAARL
ncbi:hypothetical protein [Saccharopolyspora sp. CA-218241]|uniref:hypothetical protein n=1 Tax=Saccharopolyspora sp. CA-218241 TaxID=3240027 RepID=UPI003D95C306